MHLPLLQLHHLRTQFFVLCAFGQAFWQPTSLIINLSITSRLSSAALQQLWHVSRNLAHLELTSPHVSFAAGIKDLQWLLCVRNHRHLRCLCLRGCSISAQALEVLKQCPALRALSLAGNPNVDDSAASVLAALPELLVLDVSFTSVGDAMIEALCYRLRIEAWCAAQGEPLPPGTEQWHRCKVQYWQLAGTRVSDHGVSVLTVLQKLTLLDLRRCGVPRSALAQLERRFPLLRLAQGSVLSESVFLAANVVNSEAFVCACGHTEDSGASGSGPDSSPCKSLEKAQGGRTHAGGYGQKIDAWLLEGISRLLAVSQKLVELAEQVQPPSVPLLPPYPLMSPIAQQQHVCCLHPQSMCQPHQIVSSPYQGHAYLSLDK